jgi:hypothetical protein
MAPARTGNERRSRAAVTRIDHTNRGIVSRFTDEDRIFMMVVMKLIAPKIDEAPAKCRLKMAKSTATPEWNKLPDRGG